MLAEDLIWATKVVFTEVGLPKKLFQMWAPIFSEHLKKFCRQLNIYQVITSSHHHQSNGQVEACIKFMKHTIKKCKWNNNDGNFTLLQIRSIPIGTGIPSPAMLLFNRPIRVLLSWFGREPININKDDEYYEALKSRQETYIKNNDKWYLQEFYILAQLKACSCAIPITLL